MNKVKDALTRKIGPLPAWVYLLIFTAAAYWYQNRKGKGQTVLTPANQPGVMDSQTPQDIVPLQPGESAYNPNTGQLVGTAPEQFPPQPTPDRPQPITLEPGETVYDPLTGQLLGGTPAPAAAATKTTPKKKAAPKFSLRKGITLDKGQKLRKGAHAHRGKTPGTLGPTGGFHPVKAVKKRVAKAKPKPKAPPARKGTTKARSAAAVTPPRVTKTPVHVAPKAKSRAPAPVAHAPAPRAPVAAARKPAPPPVHRAAPPPPPPRRPAPPPPPRRRR